MRASTACISCLIELSVLALASDCLAEQLNPAETDESNSALSETTIPPYAVINHEENPLSCIDGEPLGTSPITVAVWNPTEALDKIQPFALSIDSNTSNELAMADPMAAYVVRNRLVNDGKVIAGWDMHHWRSSGRQKAITAEYILSSINSPDDASVSRWITLEEGYEFFFSYATDFDESDGWTMTVESWTSEPNSTRMIGYKKTIVAVDSRPIDSLPVVASDNYMVPVYKVSGFRVFGDFQ